MLAEMFQTLAALGWNLAEAGPNQAVAVNKLVCMGRAPMIPGYLGSNIQG